MKRFTWHSWDVVSFCVRHSLYTHGDCEEYENMLDYVREHENPKMADIEKVVTDILYHSDCGKYGTIFNDWNNFESFRKIRNMLVEEVIERDEVEEN